MQTRRVIILVALVALCVLALCHGASAAPAAEDKKSQPTVEASAEASKNQQTKADKEKKRAERDARKREEEKQRILSMLEMARKMPEDKSYYNVLDVDTNANAKAIKRAFIRLSKLYHPDSNSGEDAAKKYAEVTEAYGVLKDKKLRKAYDRYLRFGETDPIYGNELAPETADILNSIVIVALFAIGAWFYFGVGKRLQDFMKPKPEPKVNIKNPSKNLKRVLNNKKAKSG